MLCGTLPRRGFDESQLLRLFGRQEHTLVTHSVRSAWDLLLQVLEFPPGSEVLLTAITIPHMVELIRFHGLVPKGLDVRSDTLGPSLSQLEAQITPRTRMVLIASLFGTRMPLDDLAQLCHERDLLLVEDNAQGLCPFQLKSPSRADVVLSSFGPIKTSTALGGGILQARSARLVQQMREVQADYPLQRKSDYYRRLLKYALLKIASWRLCYFSVMLAAQLARADVDGMVGSLARNLPGTDLRRAIRKRPCAAMQRLIHYQLTHYAPARWTRRLDWGRRLRDALESQLELPGAQAGQHGYWLFPLLVDGPDQLVVYLRQRGFDATRYHSLALVQSEPSLVPEATRMMQRLVLIPCYPEMSERAITQLIRAIQDYFESPAVSREHSGRE